jgi:hypothetical protein
LANRFGDKETNGDPNRGRLEKQIRLNVSVTERPGRLEEKPRFRDAGRSRHHPCPGRDDPEAQKPKQQKSAAV